MDRDEVIAMRQRGWSLDKISLATGKAKETIRLILCEEPGLRSLQPLPAGHEVALRGLWKGLEHRRPAS